MAPRHLLIGLRHRGMSGLRRGRALKAVIHGEAKYKRVTRSQASLELAESAIHSLIRRNFILSGVAKGVRRRFLGEFCDVIWPVGFGRSALFGDDFHAIANLC